MFTTPQRCTIKEPIKVNFESLINENDESEEEDEISRKRKKSLFTNKRVLSTEDLCDPTKTI